MVDSSALSRYSFFTGLELDQIDTILPMMEHKVFGPGTDIVVEGGHNDKLWFVVEGRVAILRGGIIIMELDEGSVFGEMEVLDVVPVAATVKALASTKVMSLSIDALGEIYEKDLRCYSFLIMNLAKDLSRRLRRMDDKIVIESPAMEWN